MSSPAKLFLHFFRWFCHPRLKKPIEGDLMELHEERAKEVGRKKADLKFIRDVLLLFRPSIIKPADGTYRLTNYGMFKNYFKVGVRNILKYKMFSFINVFGLAVAMSVCMLIILMLADQKNYDQFHEKKDRIYRVLGTPEIGSVPYATVAFPLSETMVKEYPIVEQSVSLRRGFGGDASYEQKTTELRGFFASEAFFEILDFPLVQGDKKSVLSLPNSLVISKEKAYQLFNTEDPVGKQIQFNDRGLTIMDFEGDNPPVDWGVFTVTGVVDNSSIKSHLKFEVLASASTLPILYKDSLMYDISQKWDSYYSSYSFIELRDGVEQSTLNKALTELADRTYKGLEGHEDYLLSSQKLTEITPGIVVNNESTFRLPERAYYVLSLLALVIMVMACLNYINLSVARSISRMKEIGVRKVNGATRKNLIFQFLTESIVTVMIALLVAIFILFFIKAAFMGLWVNKYLNFDLSTSISVYLIFFVFALFVGVIAGIYPALLLSKKLPVNAMKSGSGGSVKKWSLQKALNVSQLVVSLLFVVTSIVIYNQFKFYTEFEYGFDSENIVNIPLQSNDYEMMLTELGSISSVRNISACQHIPAMGTTDRVSLIDKKNIEERIDLQHLRVSQNFLDNLGLKIIAGKGIPSSGDLKKFMVINESAVTKLGYERPEESIGEIWETPSGSSRQIVGVVENFRATLLINGDEIRPLAVTNDPSSFNYLNVRIADGDPIETIATLEEKWKTLDPKHEFKYDFYENELASTNLAVFDVVSVIGYIAFLAILIACLGLLGMATYITERRTKEVGIRKVLGAGEIKIVLNLSKSFLKLLVISILIAAPLSFLLNDLWLSNFPNRVDFGFGTVVIGSLLMLGLGLLTIGSQTIRAARQNPVESLKDE